MKVSLAVTHQHGLMVGARSVPGNRYDGHTPAAQIEQTNTLLRGIGVKLTTATVDLGCRGVDRAGSRALAAMALSAGPMPQRGSLRVRW